MARFAAVCALFATFLGSVAAVSNVQAPSSPVAGQNVTVTWSSTSSDTTPVTVALFSVNTPNVTYPGGLALANSVNPQNNSVTFLWPETVPGSYQISLLSSSNTTDVLASSSTFNVAAPASSASSTATASSGLSASASVASASASAARSSITASASSALSSAASAASKIASSAGSSSSSTASTSGSAAMPVRLMGPGAGMSVGAVIFGVLVGAFVL